MKIVGLFVFLGILLVNDLAEARRYFSSRRALQVRSEEQSEIQQRRRAIRGGRRAASVYADNSQNNQNNQTQVPAETPAQAPAPVPPEEPNNNNSASSTPPAPAVNPEACVATNRPSARCEDAFHTTFSLMLIGMCRLEDHGYTASTFNVRRDQGCLRLRCLETEVADMLNSRGCSGEIIEWFSTITEYDYSNEACVTRPNTFNALNHCEL